MFNGTTQTKNYIVVMCNYVQIISLISPSCCVFIVNYDEY